MDLRRKSAESAVSVGRGSELPMTLCKHTANWRFADVARNSGALRARSRLLMNVAMHFTQVTQYIVVPLVTYKGQG